MKLIADMTIRIKRGFLPHLTNELYKRGCEIQRMALMEGGESGDLFRLEIMYSSRDKFKGLLEKVDKHAENFQLIEVRNTLEESIMGGMLNVSGRMAVENRSDYDMRIQGACELILDKIAEGPEGARFSALSRNAGLFQPVKSGQDAPPGSILRSYALIERDAVIVSRFAGLNAFPLLVKYDQTEDLIKTFQRLEPSFAVMRLAEIPEVQEIALYEQICSELSRPVLSLPYDEIPLFLLTVLFDVLRRNSMDPGESNVGLVGIDVSSLRLTRLLRTLGSVRILGYDNSEKLMYSFEKEGGLATTPENIFGNSDIIILFKSHFTIDEYSKIRPGQIILSLLPDEDLDMNIIAEKGVREFLHGPWIDLSYYLPGILKGMAAAGLGRLDDVRLIGLAGKIDEMKQGEGFALDLFGDLHERIAGLLSGLARPDSRLQ